MTQRQARNQTQLLSILRTGAKTSQELQQALGVSQPTLSRLISGSGGQVLSLGRARNTHYAILRNVRWTGGEFPVYKITTAGDAQILGTLYALEGGQFWWEPEGGQGELFHDLPWFIQDLRPEGFMGRAFAHTQSQELNLPDRLSDWNADHVVIALSQRGEDCMGNLIIGEVSLQRYFQWARQPMEAVMSDERMARYSEFARAAMDGAPPGSSAGGEQPKFATPVTDNGQIRHVLVKFSPSTDSIEGRRWADLLICEHIALQIIQEYGIQAASSHIIESQDRIFLEVTRFDRQGQFGRLPMVSLGSVDNEFFGQMDNWISAASRLERAGMLSAEDANNLRWLSVFGNLIGNTDQHFGNVSLIMEDGRRRFSVAPAYDVLPMLYRPQGNEVLARNFNPGIPAAGAIGQWSSAQEFAMKFWEMASIDRRVSEDFREICLQNLAIVNELNRGPRLIKA